MVSRGKRVAVSVLAALLVVSNLWHFMVTPTETLRTTTGSFHSGPDSVNTSTIDYINQNNRTGHLERNLTYSIETRDHGMHEKERESSQTTQKSSQGEDVLRSISLTSNETITEPLQEPTEMTVVHLDGECTLQNSDTWLNSPRYGNINITDEAWIRQMILDTPMALNKSYNSNIILKQSLCHKQSRFLSDDSTEIEAKSIRLWAVRFVYLALHYHQHYWAIPEAKARLSKQPCRTPLYEEYRVGSFDYECPDAKFMIVPLKGHGLGANMRTTVVPALLVGLATNRVVLFVNNAVDGHEDIKNPWALASCDRLDHQCFFAPMSPCVLTKEDIKNAHVFEKRGDFRRILKRNQIPKDFQSAKVWLFRHATGHTVQLPALAVERLQQYSNLLLENVEPNDPRLPIMRKAIQAIGETDPPRPNYDYAMANLKVHHALTFYAMRPNLQSAKKLKDILDDIIPADFDPNQSLGMPVRGSDKCRRESECLTFVEHMEAGYEAWTRHANTSDNLITKPTVVFTTESKSVLQEQSNFISSNSSSGGTIDRFSFERFVSNTHDVTPDTGFLPYREEDDGMTADQAMLSAISSFQAQLMARVTTGNCCSHFHHLLNDFLSEGCGAADDNSFMCLQESTNPMLRVCCGWHANCKRQPSSVQ